MKTKSRALKIIYLPQINSQLTIRKNDPLIDKFSNFRVW